MPNIVCLGEALVDMMSTAPGLSLVQSPEFHKAAGGAPTNVAAAVAILGGSAGLIAQVGEDSFGEFLRQTLWDAGVDLTHFSSNKQYATQLAFVARDEHGVPDFAFHVKQSADQMLSTGGFDDNYVGDADIFHFGSITLINEPARAATLHALEVALDEGLLVSFDPNLRPPLWKSLDQAYDQIHEVAARCDFLKVSEQEMTFLTGHDDLEKGLRALYDLGPELVAVTLGPAGCAINSGGTLLQIPGLRVPVLDTTGCGDAFVAATLVQLAEEERDITDLDADDLERIFRFSNATAALAATAEGAIPAMPGREEVLELLELGGILDESEEDEDEDELA